MRVSETEGMYEPQSQICRGAFDFNAAKGRPLGNDMMFDRFHDVSQVCVIEGLLNLL